MIADKMEVFELEPIVDDPRYEGFALEGAPSVLGGDSLDDDLTPGFGEAEENSEWRQRSLTAHWVSPRVVGRVSEFNDYPCVDFVIPAFSQRAIEVLRPLLEPHGELLPLESQTKSRFYIFNILTITDALDRSRSHCSFWCDRPTTATGIDHFEFHRNKLAGLSIFRIRELPMSVFVTNAFKERVEGAGLAGFRFSKVWPMPIRSDLKLHGSDTQKQDRLHLKQHTLVLVFPFEGSSEQKRMIEAFEKTVDRRLMVADLDEPYFGSYEGHDQNDGEYRMFFSTPDVELLYKQLQDDIQLLRWPNSITVYRRYGGMFDKDAKELVSVI